MRERRHFVRLMWLEGALLALVITPLLLFPTISVPLTFGAILLLFVLWGMEWFVARVPLIPATPFSPVLILFWITVILGVIVSADPELTFPKATGLLLGLAAWRYFAVFFRTRRLFLLGLAAFLVTGLAMMMAGALSADWQVKVPFLAGTSSAVPSLPIQLPGAPKLGIHTNELGGTIVIFLPVLVALYGWHALRESLFVRLGLTSIIALSVAILLLTQSRSAWAGAIGGIIVFLLARIMFLPKPRLRSAVMVGFASLIVIILVGLSQIDPVRLNEILAEPPRETAVGTLTTFTFRRELWGAAIEVIQDTPFTGTGLGAFRRVVPRLYPTPATTGGEVAHAHNMFLQVAADIGLIGVASYGIILIIAAVLCWRQARRNGEFQAVSLGLLGSIVGLHTFGILDAIALGAKPGLLFWMALGLITVLRKADLTVE